MQKLAILLLLALPPGGLQAAEFDGGMDLAMVRYLESERSWHRALEARQQGQLDQETLEQARRQMEQALMEMRLIEITSSRFSDTFTTP